MFNFRIQWQENQGQNPVTACMIRAHSSGNQTSHIFVWRSWPTATTQLSQNSPHNPPNRFIYTQTYPHLTLTFYSTFLTTLGLIFSPFVVYFNALASKLGRHHLRVYTPLYMYTCQRLVHGVNWLSGLVYGKSVHEHGWNGKPWECGEGGQLQVCEVFLPLPTVVGHSSNTGSCCSHGCEQGNWEHSAQAWPWPASSLRPCPGQVLLFVFFQVILTKP